MSRLFQWIVPSALILWGCGGEFYPKEPEIPEIRASSNSLLPNTDWVDWYFPCSKDKEEDDVEFTADGKQLVYGHGPFLNSRQENQKAQVSAKFNLCPPAATRQPRQLLLLRGAKPNCHDHAAYRVVSF